MLPKKTIHELHETHEIGTNRPGSSTSEAKPRQIAINRIDSDVVSDLSIYPFQSVLICGRKSLFLRLNWVKGSSCSGKTKSGWEWAVV